MDYNSDDPTTRCVIIFFLDIFTQTVSYSISPLNMVRVDHVTTMEASSLSPASPISVLVSGSIPEPKLGSASGGGLEGSPTVSDQ